MSNRSSHFAHRFQTLPSALAGVSGSRRLLALAAVLALLVLALLPTTGQAQTAETQIWSETMTVGSRTAAGLVHLGWSDTGTYTGAALSDQDFDYGDHTYNLEHIYLVNDSLFSFSTTPARATSRTRPPGTSSRFMSAQRPSIWGTGVPMRA